MVKKELNKNELKKRLEVCFKKCADGRNQLRNSVIKAMDTGFKKEEVLAIASEMTKLGLKDEATLCSITAIGQALSYRGETKKIKSDSIISDEKEKVKNRLIQGFKKCGITRRQLRKCVVNALNAGLSKEELLGLTDDIVGGLGKNEVSVCAIVAIDEILKYEEIDKLKKMVKLFAPYMEFNE
ncbi:MAG: hypothetical protein JSV62_02250 [Promethearchaeota archaeon]|nr:MAG: hypothetical protein JSV62_02250 [Candidatus Lokiarchaeota archaeon]